MSNDKRSIIRSILARAVLAGFASGWAAGPDVTSSYPESAVVEAVEDEQLARMPPRLRARTMHVLAADPRSPVRAAIASRSGDFELPLSQATRRLLAELASDPVPAVQQSLGRGLARRLEALAPLERVDVLCSWTTSRHGGLRLAAALILTESLDVVGAPGCLEHLAGDPLPAVRARVANAAVVRHHRAPRLCRRVLLDLASDRDPGVAHAAQRGLANLHG